MTVIAMTLLKRLWDRRFFHILGSYLAGGWIGLELVDQLVNRGRLPEVMYSLALLWYVSGIVAASLVAWHHGAKGRQRAPRSEVAALVVLSVVTITLSGSTVATYSAERAALAAAAASRLDLRRVAVLYFDDLSPDGELVAVADGLTEATIDELATVRGLDVLSRGAVEPYRGAGHAVQRVGRALEAGTLVAGSVERIGERVRICFRLLDGESGIEFRRTSFDLAPADLLSARDTLVSRASGMLREWLGEEIRVHQSRQTTNSLPAWLLYQRAERSRKDAEVALMEGDLEGMQEFLDVADALLVEAQRADGTWPEPAVLRGHVAYRRARVAGSADEVVRLVELGLSRVAPALTLEPNHPRALEVRGTLKYWLWLHGLEPDPGRSDALFHAARADLERAVRVDPGLASAHASLSHLYLNAPDLPAAVLAARRAYEEDAYLENADAIVWRLVTSSYNLEQFIEMLRWCNVGQRRFPDHFRFTSCQLILMTTPAVTPDIPHAWSLLARLDSLAPPNQRDFERLRGELLTGGALARAGLPDSARAVLARTHESITHAVDPDRDLLRVEAYIRTLLGDYDQAVDLLKLDAAMHPGSDYAQHWWWRELRSHPGWREVVGP
jgi:TolB-like protein/tetratricopeptide (TPR) repeat protein